MPTFIDPSGQQWQQPPELSTNNDMPHDHGGIEVVNEVFLYKDLVFEGTPPTVGSTGADAWHLTNAGDDEFTTTKVAYLHLDDAAGNNGNSTSMLEFHEGSVTTGTSTSTRIVNIPLGVDLNVSGTLYAASSASASSEMDSLLVKNETILGTHEATDELVVNCTSAFHDNVTIDSSANFLQIVSHNGVDKGLKLGATLVKATAAELNIMDGVTATTAELNIMDGVTATAAELNLMDGVTATTAELNYLDVTLLGTSEASKAVTADANGLITVGTGNFSYAGTTISATGAEINTLDGITASTAELNLMDGVTATTAELNIMDGVTATAAELNIMDGVTATAAELNIMDGVTATAAELNLMDGVTATTAELNYLDVTLLGTSEASKAVTADANGLITVGTGNFSYAGTTISATGAEINTLDGITASTAELNLMDGVTATTAELNYLDVTLLGTSEASKAVTADANGLITVGTGNFSYAGTTISATGAEINTLDGITASTAELNLMDGVTATTAELNIMDGVTATAAELNIMDGVTATAAELNIMDGVTATAAELNLMDGVTATTAELNYLDVTLLGTSEASKAVTADANGLITVGTGNFSYAGTTISATGAEINTLDGITASTAELNLMDGVTATTAELNIMDGVTATAAELNIMDGVTATAAELNIMDGVTATAAELNLMDGVTATTAELNYLDVTLLGTSEASKAVTADVNGLITVGTGNFSYAGTTISATGAEINTLDGITASTAELNLMDGVTATTAELNIMDGVTATAAELNIMDGVTATAAELNLMDGNTAATSTTLIDGDRLVVNDGGVMRQVALTDFETYFESALDTLSNVTTVGALTSGSIATGFGTISTGSNITTSATGNFGDITSGAISCTANISAVDMTLSGNLTVAGTTTYLNTTETNIKDSRIVIGSITDESWNDESGGGTWANLEPFSVVFGGTTTSTDESWNGESGEIKSSLIYGSFLEYDVQDGWTFGGKSGERDVTTANVKVNGNIVANGSFTMNNNGNNVTFELDSTGKRLTIVGSDGAGGTRKFATFYSRS